MVDKSPYKTISLIYILTKGDEALKTVRSVAALVDRMDYPKGQYEVIFYILGEASGYKKLDSLPMVRIFYINSGRTGALYSCVEQALGDIVVIAEPQAAFLIKDSLKMLNEDFKAPGLWVKFGPHYYAGRKKLLPWNAIAHHIPKDIACEKSYVAMDALKWGHEIKGDAGRLNRKEILRIIYSLERLTVKQKAWLFMKYCGGV